MRPIRSLRLGVSFSTARALILVIACFLALQVPGRAPATARAGSQPAAAVAISGTPVPTLQSFDAAMTALMTKWQIPGAALAVTKDGRLVMAHGYGLADVEQNQPARPDSLFRIASLTKAFTATGALLLVEQGKLDLDTPAFALIPQFGPPQGAKVDPRLSSITVRQLLQHTGGWDRDKSGDPMFESPQISAAMGTRSPASCPTTISYMMGQPLDFDPGTQYVYSNFGYCVLGRIIEQASGQTYPEFIRSQVLAPAGITRMREGRPLLAGRAPSEVRYYSYSGEGLVDSVFPPPPARAPGPYGSFNLLAMDSHGGWIASAVDLVKFLTALDGQRPPAILQASSVNTMTARPAAPVSRGDPVWYGMGLMIRGLPGGAENWWHEGGLDGTETEMARYSNGAAFAVLFNSRPQDDNGFGSEIDSKLADLATSISNWPSGDSFGQFP
jgi:CubicO group peptidase (beta-lactamase class C family)